MAFYTLFAGLKNGKNTALESSFVWGLDYEDEIFLSILDLSKKDLLTLLSASESRAGSGMVDCGRASKLLGRKFESEPSTLEICMALQVNGHMDCYPKFVSQFGT
jgi:hypothetical protein